MSRLVVVVPIVDGARDRVEELLRSGPPFEIEATQLSRHEVFLTDREVIFDFETPGSEPRSPFAPRIPPSTWRPSPGTPSWRASRGGRCRLSPGAARPAALRRAARDRDARVPARRPSARRRVDRPGVEPAADDQPGDQGVRVPHLARAQLVAAPDGRRHLRHQPEQTPCAVEVVAEAAAGSRPPRRCPG